MKPNQSYNLLFAIIILIYISLTFFLPPDPILHSRYHLTNGGIFLVNLSLVLPLILIWSMAFYGATRVKSYAEIIKNEPDGRPLNILGTGLLWLVFASPLSSSVSTFLNYLGRVHPSIHSGSRIMTNYVSVIVNLVAILFIARGAEALVSIVKKKPSAREQYWWVVGFIGLSCVYCFLLITQRSPSDNFVLPNWLLLITLAIPYLYIWFRGLLAAYQLHYYKQKVRGKLYRQALQYLSRGITAVILISILIQFISTASLRINRLKLTPLLIIVYCLLVLLAIAYALIAVGAKRLKRIEEV